MDPYAGRGGAGMPKENPNDLPPVIKPQIVIPGDEDVAGRAFMQEAMGRVYYREIAWRNLQEERKRAHRNAVEKRRKKRKNAKNARRKG